MQASCSSSPLASSSSLTLNHSKDISSAQSCPRIDQISSDVVDLKRKYLALLPPTQIIDLCLAFEAQVPVHLQTSLWPSDFNAAIVRLQEPPKKQDQQEQPKLSPTPPPEKAPSIAEVPIKDHDLVMAALTDTANEQEPPTAETNGDAKTIVDIDIVSISSSRTPSPVPAQNDPAPQSAHPAASPAPSVHPVVIPAPSAHPAASPVPVLSPVPTVPSAAAATPTPTPHSHYPHTHYSYTAAASAYPHAPYYSMPPPGAYYYAGGHYYPHYGHLPTAHQPTINPQPSVPSSFYPSVPPSAQNHYGATTNGASASGEDLPSYEEMLVEALTNCDEGEGCPPKALFLWMAAQYPLQVNFRPSASQALQKAHKRGRFGKNDAGRYFLQRDWEGGSVRAQL